MKIFILVIVIAIVIGGFVGGEIMDKTFSILGATIGGVGLTTILLGLGAYFTAKEEKKRKQQLSPEIQGVFDRMFGGSSTTSAAPQAWKPCPFYANKTKEDFLRWFANVPPWNKVDATIIEMLVGKFESNPLFEVFVHTSQDQGLINKYAQLNHIARTDAGRFAIYPRIAMILSAAAEDSRAAIAKAMSSKNVDSMKTHYAKAIDSLETAILIEPNVVLLYLQIATLKAMIGKNEEAAEYCRAGLKKIDEQRKVPFGQSAIDSVRGAHAENERIGGQLKSVLTQVSS
jgi:tetratricopeptide (TPR) repeat protein